MGTLCAEVESAVASNISMGMRARFEVLEAHVAEFSLKTLTAHKIELRWHSRKYRRWVGLRSRGFFAIESGGLRPPHREKYEVLPPVGVPGDSESVPKPLAPVGHRGPLNWPNYYTGILGH